MLALQIYKDRRCSTCTVKDQQKYGCETDITPFYFDDVKLTRCPLRPYKDDPAFFSELFKLYSFREKNVLAESGGFYDQPAFYIEAMTEMDGAMADSYDMKDKVNSRYIEEENKKTDALAARGIVFRPKE